MRLKPPKTLNQIGLLLVQRRRRWASIKPAFVQRVALAWRPFSHKANYKQYLHAMRQFWICWAGLPFWLMTIRETPSSLLTRDVHPILVKRWPTVCNIAAILIQHWVNDSCLLRMYLEWRHQWAGDSPANTRHRPNVDLLLAQRPRRSSNINVALIGVCRVFRALIPFAHPVFSNIWYG